MGQSVLRHRRKPFLSAAAVRVNSSILNVRKGIGLIFPNLDTEIEFLRAVKRGNTNKLGYISGGPGKSFLFFLRIRVPGIGSPEIGMMPVKRRGSCGVSVLLSALENPREILIFVPDRTHIRIRSPR